MSAPPQRRHRILVAEDDDAVRKMIGHLLGDIADVTIAKDGMEALIALRDMEKAPDLIVTDLMMPRLDGLGLLKQVRANETSKNIPIIILTAKAQPMDVITGINAGARHYLVKPFKREELLEKVRKVLRLD
ncbi:MAG: response regulator [Polyangiales bacterium]